MRTRCAPAPRRPDETAQQVRSPSQTVAAKRDWSFFETEISRSEVVDSVCTHGYGTHGKRIEYFGTAIAKLVAGGRLPFVPDDGGQVELVCNHPALLYSSVESAVKQIDAVLPDPHRAHELRLALPGMPEFGHDRFQREIASYVEKTL